MSGIIYSGLYLVFCMGLYGMFEKMSEEPWLAFVPVLNLYILISRTWNQTYFWIMAVLGIGCLLMPYLYNSNGHPLVLTGMMLQVILMVMWLNASLHAAACFGKNAAAGILFALLPFIGSFWLANASFHAPVRMMSMEERNEMSRMQLI